MAILYITEFNTIGRDNNNATVMAPLAPSAADQTVAVGAASAQSAALRSGTNLVRIVSDVTCSVKFGVNPTATASTMRLSADSAEYFAVPAGISMKIAVITNT
jgi:hypothetical protein